MPTDVGCCNLVRQKIVLIDDSPFKQPYRKIPPSMYEEVRQHLKEMLKCGAIKESDITFSSNVVLVRKKDGSLRFCLDFLSLILEQGKTLISYLDSMIMYTFL